MKSFIVQGLTAVCIAQMGVRNSGSGKSPGEVEETDDMQLPPVIPGTPEAEEFGLPSEEELEKEMKRQDEEEQEAMVDGERQVETRKKKMLRWMSDAVNKQPTSVGGGPAWPGGVVRWCTDNYINPRTLTAFKLAAKQYEEAFPGCISFQQVNTVGANCEGYPQQDAVFVLSQSNLGCQVNGMVGSWPYNLRRMWGRHHLNLAPEGCTYGISTAIHEVGHALGMSHEQSRPDRDSHIIVQYNSMRSEWRGQFAKDMKAYTRVPYDYNSVMHYGRREPSVHIRGSSTQDIMTPINCGSNCPQVFGNKVGLSKNDHDQLKDMYSCPASKTATWTNGSKCVDQPGSSKGGCSRYSSRYCNFYQHCWMVRKYNAPSTGRGGSSGRGGNGGRGGGSSGRGRGGTKPPVKPTKSVKYYKASFSFTRFQGVELQNYPGWSSVRNLAEVAKFTKQHVPTAVGFYSPPSWPQSSSHKQYIHAIYSYAKINQLITHRPLYLFSPDTTPSGGSSGNGGRTDSGKGRGGKTDKGKKRDDRDGKTDSGKGGKTDSGRGGRTSCKDSHRKLCKTLVKKGFCWAKTIQKKCRKACGKCNSKPKNNLPRMVKMRLDGGAKYFGLARRGKPNGMGVSYSRSFQYVGDWKRGEYHGFGYLRQRSGTYIGSFRYGEKSGRGYETFKRGGKYSGYYDDGLYDGRGKLTLRNGKVQKGYFSEGKFVGKNRF